MMETIEKIRELVAEGKIQPPDTETETDIDWETVINGIYYKVTKNEWYFFSYFKYKQLTEEQAFKALTLLKELKDILQIEKLLIDVQGDYRDFTGSGQEV